MNPSQKPTVQPQQGSFPQTTTVNQPGATYPTGITGTVGNLKPQVVTAQVNAGYTATAGYPLAGNYPLKPGYPVQAGYLPTAYNVQTKPGVVGQTYPVPTIPQQGATTLGQKGVIPVQQGFNYPVVQYPPYQQKIFAGNVGTVGNTGTQPQIITKPQPQPVISNSAQGTAPVTTAPKVAQQPAPNQTVPASNSQATNTAVQPTTGTATTAKNTTNTADTTNATTAQNVPTTTTTATSPTTATTTTINATTTNNTVTSPQPNTTNQTNPGFPNLDYRKNIRPGLMD